MLLFVCIISYPKIYQHQYNPRPRLKAINVDAWLDSNFTDVRSIKQTNPAMEYRLEGLGN